MTVLHYLQSPLGKVLALQKEVNPQLQCVSGSQEHSCKPLLPSRISFTEAATCREDIPILSWDRGSKELSRVVC